MQKTDVSAQGTATPGGGGDPGAPATAPSSSPPSLSTTTTPSAGPPASSGAAGSAPPSQPAPEPASAASAASYEEEHVHRVYESIAPHFSATRYKPWPVIAGFLQGLAPGAVGFDVGCGNGKYLGVNPDVVVVGADRSAALARLARDHGGNCRQDVAVADGLALPFPLARADFALCVAVLHHLSTRPRRRDAVRALLDCLRFPSVPGTGEDEGDGGGRVLLYVWALEQSGSRRGWDEGSDQDLLVPWVMKQKKEKKDAAAGAPVGDTTYQRYYHLFKKGELEEDVLAVGGKVLDHGYDKDNWWVVAGRAN